MDKRNRFWTGTFVLLVLCGTARAQSGAILPAGRKNKGTIEDEYTEQLAP